MATDGSDPWDDKTNHESNLKIYDTLKDYLEKSKHFRTKTGDNNKAGGSKSKPKIKTNRHGYPSIECSPEQREKDEKRIREMMSQWWG